MIHIYSSSHCSSSGPAAAPACVEYTKRALLEIGIEPDRIAPLTQPEEILSISEKNPTLIFPGGNALSLMDDVKNVSEQIHSLITEGTTALGICAGSIFLSSELLSEPNRPGGHTHRIKPKDSLFHGPLDLVPLTAEVPVFRNEEGWAKLGYTQAVIEFCPSQKRALLPFADGAKFSIDEDWNGEITARYAEAAELPIAAWHTECGRGKAIGIGFHPELPLPGFSEITPEGLEFLKDELSWSGSMS